MKPPLAVERNDRFAIGQQGECGGSRGVQRQEGLRLGPDAHQSKESDNDNSVATLPVHSDAPNEFRRENPGREAGCNRLPGLQQAADRSKDTGKVDQNVIL